MKHTGNLDPEKGGSENVLYHWRSERKVSTFYARNSKNIANLVGINMKWLTMAEQT